MTQVLDRSLQISPVAIYSFLRQQVAILSHKQHQSLKTHSNILDLSSNDAVNHAIQDIVLLQRREMLQPLLRCYFCTIFSQFRHEVASYLLQQGYLLMDLIFLCELLDTIRRVFKLIVLLLRVQVLRVHLQLAQIVIHIDLLFFIILVILLVNGSELASLPKQRYQLPFIDGLPFLEVVDDLMRSVLVNKRQGFYLLGKEYLE